MLEILESRASPLMQNQINRGINQLEPLKICGRFIEGYFIVILLGEFRNYDTWPFLGGALNRSLTVQTASISSKPLNWRILMFSQMSVRLPTSHPIFAKKQETSNQGTFIYFSQVIPSRKHCHLIIFNFETKPLEMLYTATCSTVLFNNYLPMSR